MKRYRRFVTTGELRHKRNERREYIFLILMAIILLAGLLGIGYVNIPSARLLSQTALPGITYRPLLVLVMVVMGSLLCAIAMLLLTDRKKGIVQYVKIAAFGIAFGALFGGSGFNLLLNINRWLADEAPVRKEYKVTDIDFLKRNRTGNYKVPNFSISCRILEAVCPDNPQEKYYFHVPTDTQVAMGCTLYTTERNGIFGWKVLDGIEYDCMELFLK